VPQEKHILFPSMAVVRILRLCFTNRVTDSSLESSVVAVLHAQTDTPDLQDPELASL
jgi:hypothetical protein